MACETTSTTRFGVSVLEKELRPEKPGLSGVRYRIRMATTGPESFGGSQSLQALKVCCWTPKLPLHGLPPVELHAPRPVIESACCSPLICIRGWPDGRLILDPPLAAGQLMSSVLATSA